MKSPLFSSSLFQAALLLFSLSSSAFASDPCAETSRFFKGFEGRGGTTVELLNNDVSVVGGTARSLARCEMRGNPSITACLTTATARRERGTLVVFEIYGWGDEAPKGAVIVPSGRRNTVLDTPAFLDAHHGEWNVPLYSWWQAGEETFVSLDKSTGELMFEAFDLGAVQYGYWGFGLTGGSLTARAKFDCTISE